MPKAKQQMTQKQFSSLTLEQQGKELKKLTKRANVRLDLLNKTNIKNQAFQDAIDFNRLGNNKLKFSETKNYKSTAESFDTFQAVTNFLNNKTSTLGGVKEQATKRINDIIKDGKTDKKDIAKLSDKEVKYMAQELAKKANRKLAVLEKNKAQIGVIQSATYYNRDRKNNRFESGLQIKDRKLLEQHIRELSTFVNAKSSTMTGVNEIIKDVIQRFRDKGVNIAKGDEKQFMDFLSSNIFTKLGQHADSNQVVETYVDAINKKEESTKIDSAFKDFIDGEIKFDEVQERLKVAKWQDGGLLQ